MLGLVGKFAKVKSDAGWQVRVDREAAGKHRSLEACEASYRLRGFLGETNTCQSSPLCNQKARVHNACHPLDSVLSVHVSDGRSSNR